MTIIGYIFFSLPSGLSRLEGILAALHAMRDRPNSVKGTSEISRDCYKWFKKRHLKKSVQNKLTHKQRLSNLIRSVAYLRQPLRSLLSHEF